MTIQLGKKERKKISEKYLQPKCLCKCTRLIFEICDEICLILPPSHKDILLYNNTYYIYAIVIPTIVR